MSLQSLRNTIASALNELEEITALTEAEKGGERKKPTPRKKEAKKKAGPKRAGPRKLAPSPFEKLAREKEQTRGTKKSRFAGRRVTNILKKKEDAKKYRAQIAAKQRRNKATKHEIHHGKSISLKRTRDVTDRSVRSHNPFKRRSTMGPTRVHAIGSPPRGTRSVGRKREWSCRKIEKYKQMCIGKPKKEGGKKRKMVVKIDPGYKRGYNKAWKQWEKHLRHKGHANQGFYLKHGSHKHVGA